MLDCEKCGGGLFGANIGSCICGTAAFKAVTKAVSAHDLKIPGAKDDSGKPSLVRGALQYFPRALFAVGALSQAGAEKYSWRGWEKVPDGVSRYTEALGRHLAAEADEVFDPEWADKGKNIRHATAVAWNALARLELMLRAESE